MSMRLSARRSEDRRSIRRRGVGLFTAGAVAFSMLTTGLVAATIAPASAAAPQAAALSLPIVATQAPNIPGRGNTTLTMFQWTWNSVAKECTSTIGPAGFAYVQVSPPQETIQGTEWWTSYQPVSYKLESKLGTRAEFKNMIDTCNTAGVKIIADAVINHMSGADKGGGTGVAGSTYGVDNYPGLYGAGSFNDCREDIGNRYGDRYVVQNCRLVSLQDLRTGSDDVRNKIAGYFNDMISLGVVGFRLDASKHIPAADLEAIKGKLTDQNVFWIHEVIGAAGEPIQPSEYLGSGDSHEFNYARGLKSNFDGRIANLKNISNGLLSSDRAGVFVDNHDTERNEETMNYRWGAKYKLANVFMLAYPYGSPSVYSGYQFTGGKPGTDAGAPGATATKVPDADCANSAWVCTQRWPEITGMVGFRTAVGDAAVTNWWDNGTNQIAFGRGSKGFVVVNNEGAGSSRTFQTSLPAGEYCDVVADSSCLKKVTVNSSGQFTATIPAFGALAIHVGANLPVEQCTNDTVKPTVPTGVTATASGTTINVSWTASTDNCTSSPVTYEVKRTGGGTADVTSPVTGTTFAATSLTPATDYTFTVVAVDGSASRNKSAASASAKATTAATGSTTATVYYSTSKSWSKYYAHYRAGTGAWTTAPGVEMTPACTGWVTTTVNLGQNTGGNVVFTNGTGTWDNNATKDYTLAAGNVTVKDNAVTTNNPCGDVVPTDKTTVYYSTTKSWSAYNVHYKVGTAAWTVAPGAVMAPACAGWVSKEIPTPAGATVTAAFTNGSGTWDSNNAKNYVLSGAAAAVKDGAVSTTNPCGSVVAPSETLKVFYSTSASWSAYNVHYKVGTGAWTAQPGVALAPACAGWVTRTIPTPAGATVTAVFTNGSGTWDNNGAKDYVLAGAAVSVKDGVVTTAAPCPE